MLKVEVFLKDPKYKAQSQALAQRLGLLMQEKLGENADFSLYFEENQLYIQDLSQKQGAKASIDFLGGRVGYRTTKGGGKGQLIAKACGAAPKFILDATTGFGEDAYALAVLGHKVWGIEKNPIVFSLLEDAVSRLALQAPDIQFHIIHANAIDFLEDILEPPEVIYLDPMFPEPEHKKSALSKKEMQILQKLLRGEEGRTDELFAKAMSKATERVVVKRPIDGPPLSDHKHQSIASDTTRMDIYLT